MAAGTAAAIGPAENPEISSIPESVEDLAMKKVAAVMTRDVAVLAPIDTVQHAAQLMEQLNVGIVPVCEGARLVGVITDRDITVRVTAVGGAAAETAVSGAMSTKVCWCTEDQDVDAVLAEMGATQIRRIPVVDSAQNLVGIVSLGDIATRATTETGGTLRQISSPSQPHRHAQ
jgi:CBS domain-containing protein